MEAATALSPAENGAASLIAIEQPYTMTATLRGTAALLFNRWSCEDVAEKAAAKKNSKAKKTDNLESKVYRDDTGRICLPAEYVRQAMCHAAKFRQDPRSPRKSAFDLFKAGVAVMEELAPINGGVKDWQYIDQRRVQVQRNGVTRMRPAFLNGWTAEVWLSVLLPEYIDKTFFSDVLVMAGRLIGVGDFRPTYGRFQVDKLETL